jgi:hypothetical protein
MPVDASYAIATVPGTVPVITTDLVDGGAGAGAGVVPKALPSPPPPHETRIIARKAKSNDAGRYVVGTFLISISLLSKGKGGFVLTDSLPGILEV